MKMPTDVMRALWRNRTRRNSAEARRRQCPVEMLERRIVPTLTSHFDIPSSTLTITATAAESITVTAVSGNVAVNGNVAFDGVGTSTAAADVAKLVIQGGTGANNINLSGVTEAVFVLLSEVSITGGLGNDVIVGSEIADTIIWNNGDGSDRIDGGAGQDKLVVNGSTTAGDAFSVSASAGRLQFRRTNLVAFTLNVGTVEDLLVSAGGGNDTISVGNTAGTSLGNATLLGGAGDDTVNLTGINLDALSLLTVDGDEGNDVVVVSAGTGAGLRGGDGVADQFVLSLVDTVDGPEVELSVNGTTIFAGADESARIQIDGSRDADTLTVNYNATLGFPVPVNGLLFNAGSGSAQDQLVVAGTAEVAAYDFFNVRNGSATVDFRTLNFIHLESITDQLAPITDTDPDTQFTIARSVFFGNGADQVTLADSDTAVDRVLRLTSLGSSPPLKFTQPEADGTLSGSLTIDAGGGNDLININTLDNNFVGDLLLDGSAGNDRFVIASQMNVTGSLDISADGGAGGDILDASAVTQGVVLFGGAGDDTLRGGRGGDGLFGQEGADVLTGGLGDDILNGGANADVLAETADTDLTLAVGSDEDLAPDLDEDLIEQTVTVLSGLGTDSIAEIERAELSGGDGNNVIDATSFTAAVVLRGGGGADELIGTAFNDTIFGGSGNDSMSGLAGADVLNGDADNDSLTGGQGDDQLNGGIGNDDFVWLNGDNSDAISGGLGADALQVSGHETLGDVFQLTSSGSGARFSRTNLVPFSLNFSTVEFLVVEGGGGNDSFTVTLVAGAARPSEISFGGGDGRDSLDASATSLPVFAFGDAGNDTLIGGRGADSLQGGADDDMLTGNSGADDLHGGDGIDAIDGGSGRDFAAGDDGDDVIRGGADQDTLEGNDGEDIIHGDGGDDCIRGGDGNDELFGDAGNDLMNGGNDDDLLDGGADNDGLSGFAGNDRLRGGTGADILVGGAGEDDLDGGSGRDICLGGDDDDIVRGGADRDTLAGGSGAGTVPAAGDSFPDDIIPTEIDEAFMFAVLPTWINAA